jgi:uncharacterized protein YceK
MKPFFMILIATLLSGCVTLYQKEGFSGGYSETQLGENIFQVSFRGNGHTSRERVSDFSLLRSAEVTIENGYRYFVIVDSEKYNKVGSFTTPATSYTTGSAYASGNYAYGSSRSTTYGGQTIIVSKPRANNTIYCFKEKPDNAMALDANFVIKSIRDKYELDEQVEN